jgi:hypothetical protein
LKNIVLVSIDESSFKSRVGHTYRWRFDKHRKWTKVRKLLENDEVYTMTRRALSPMKSLTYNASRHSITIA